MLGYARERLHFIEKMCLEIHKASELHFPKISMESGGQPGIFCINCKSVPSPRDVCHQIAGQGVDIWSPGAQATSQGPPPAK